MQTSQLRFLCAAALAAAAFLTLFSCASEPPPEAPPPPNIVLVMTDDQGWAQLGYRGNEVLKTPNIDRLAAESVEIPRFYVAPVCAPTRASLMTGRYNYRTGVVDTYLGRAMMYPGEVTLAEALGEAGYRTGIFGKWHLGDNYPLRPQDQGFDDVLVHKGGGIEQPSDPPGSGYFDPILQENGEQKQHRGYCTDIFFDAALRFIDRHQSERFFAYIPTNAPHSPYIVPDSYIEPYKEAGLNDKDARIYGMITNIDDNMGRLLSRLDELGLSENTIVIFMTDNGPTTQRYTAGLRAQKTSVYEGGIRVPFFLRWPARLESGKVEQIAAHIDVMPTLLDAAGAPAPEGVKIDGVSLMPLLSGEGADWPERTIYIQSHRGDVPELYRNFAAIRQRYKLVQPLSFSEPMPRNPSFELYGIEADPGETNDLSGEHPEIVSAMKQGYEQWFEDVSSTRGYDPPRIFLGSEHENPVTLTRQDWRVAGEDGWSDEHLGYWEVEVVRSGTYEIRLRFPPQEAAGRAEFAFGGVTRSKAFTGSAEQVTFSGVELPAGEGTLEVRLVRGDQKVGVKYVDVKREQ